MAIRTHPADDTDDDTALPEMVREALSSSRALGYVLILLGLLVTLAAIITVWAFAPHGLLLAVAVAALFWAVLIGEALGKGSE